MDSNEMGPKWKTRIVEGEFPGREFDIEFWQEQGDEAIFRAAEPRYTKDLDVWVHNSSQNSARLFRAWRRFA